MKSSAARGWALISVRSWSSAARQSTRSAVSEGLRNSSAASGEAMKSESDARSCETKRKLFPTTVSPPAAPVALALAPSVLGALGVGAVFGHHDDSGADGDVRRHGGAHAVG